MNDKQKQETLDNLATWTLYLFFAIIAILTLAVTFRVAAWILGLL